MISRCRGSRASNSSTGHFSRASGSSVWLVYASVRTVRSHASSQPSFASSSRMRISSGTAIAGWVSLSWMATLSGSAGQSLPRRRNRATMSASEQATRKYSWRNRSDRPRGVESSGYRTRVTDSARIWSDTAPKKSPPLNSPKSKTSGGRGLPQAEGVDRPPAVADDRPVVGDAEQVRRLPAVRPRSRRAVHLERRCRAGPTPSRPAATTSHGSGRVSQWSGCSTWEPSRISWRKMP